MEPRHPSRILLKPNGHWRSPRLNWVNLNEKRSKYISPIVFCTGASHFLWLCGCGATSSSFEEVGPADVFEAASYGEQGVGARFRPAASRRFESVAEDVLAGTFHDAGSNRQSMLPIEVALHSVRVGLVGANAGRDNFGLAAVRLQNGDHMSGPPRPPFASLPKPLPERTMLNPC